MDICGEWRNKLWKNGLTGGFWECGGTAERERGEVAQTHPGQETTGSGGHGDEALTGS